MSMFVYVGLVGGQISAMVHCFQSFYFHVNRTKMSSILLNQLRKFNFVLPRPFRLFFLHWDKTGWFDDLCISQFWQNLGLSFFKNSQFTEMEISVFQKISQFFENFRFFVKCNQFLAKFHPKLNKFSLKTLKITLQSQNSTVFKQKQSFLLLLKTHYYFS